MNKDAEKLFEEAFWQAYIDGFGWDTAYSLYRFFWRDERWQGPIEVPRLPAMVLAFTEMVNRKGKSRALLLNG